MGEWANVFVFDFEQWVDEAVPAVRAAMLSGRLDPWAEVGAWDRSRRGDLEDYRRRARARMKPTDLQAVCTWLEPQTLGQPLKTSRPTPESGCSELCPREECPAYGGCTFGGAPVLALQVRFNLHDLAASYAGPGHYFVKYGDGQLMDEELDSRNVDGDSRLRTLIRTLATRSWYGRWGGVATTLGRVCGWLDPSETTELAGRILELRLPPPAPPTGARWKWEFADLPGHSNWYDQKWNALQIMASRASELGLGLIWLYEKTPRSRFLPNPAQSGPLQIDAIEQLRKALASGASRRSIGLAFCSLVNLALTAVPKPSPGLGAVREALQRWSRNEVSIEDLNKFRAHFKVEQDAAACAVEDSPENQAVESSYALTGAIRGALGWALGTGGWLFVGDATARCLMNAGRSFDETRDQVVEAFGRALR